VFAGGLSEESLFRREKTMPLILSKFLKSVAAVMLFASAGWAALLPYYSSMPRVSVAAVSFDNELKKTWEGIKARNVDKYNTGMVHRPKSNMPDDAVSEGISYGMYLALYSNDREYFNKIWNAGEQYMWNEAGKLYDWRVNRSGEKIGMGPASDADQDIALLLIFADRLVQRGIWQPYTSVNGATYASRARALLNTVRTTMVASNGALLPGQWGQNGIINPGYFAPAFYRVFAEFDSTNRASWNALIDGCYAMIAKSPGYSLGLVPDWFDFDGQSTGGAGYNAYFKGDALYRDAIRVYWRIGIDYLWYGESRAKVFLDSAMVFIEKKGGASAANFFDIKGDFLPLADVETLSLGKDNIVRTRREHSPLTVGMWAIAALASGGAVAAQSYSDELLKFYQPGTDYWGYAVDPSGGTEDTLHNEMYFDQFLAWFGASALGGAFTNVWEDLKEGVPQGPPAWEAWPVLNTRDIDAEIEPLRVTASFNRSVRWAITIRHDTSGREVSFGGNSENVDAVWYGLSPMGDYMPQGLYTLTVSGAGIDEIYTGKVWLGRPFSKVNLMVGKRLLVDDFADGDAIPYIGKEWTSFYDSDFGQAGASTAAISVKKESDGKEWLGWAYKLNAGHLGFDPYAGLDWNCNTAADAKGIDITGVDTLAFTAKTAGGTVSVSVQLVSSDFNFPGEYQYFSDSIILTAVSGEFVLPLKNFKQRRDGSGKELSTTLKKLTSIRFQVQEKDGTAGTIMLERVLFAGDVSKLYTPPPPAPDYVAPPEGVLPIGVRYRGTSQPKYTTKRGSNAVVITLPAGMAGAPVSLVDIRGRTVMRLDVQGGGRLSVPLRSLARGVYFVDISGRENRFKIKVFK
jgi:endo-1,4-beta-D-glucanase Y